MATPNNFKVTSAIGETDNFIGADINFYHITLKNNSASAVDWAACEVAAEAQGVILRVLGLDAA